VDNTSGGLRRRAIPDLQGSPFVCCLLSSFNLPFFVSRYFSHRCAVFLFPAILVAQVLWEQWVILLQYGYGVGDISAVILSCWFLYICMWVPGFCTSTQGLHSCIASLSVLVSSLCSPGPSLCLTKHGVRAFVFLFEFFIAQKSSMHRIRERGVWMDMDGISRNGFAYVFINFAMDSTTFSSTSRSACFGDLQASTSAHHDVYTGGRLLRIMHHWTTNIYVWIPSHRHPSR